MSDVNLLYAVFKNMIRISIGLSVRYAWIGYTAYVKAFCLKALLFQMMLIFNVCVVHHVSLRISLGIILLPNQKKIVNVNAN